MFGCGIFISKMAELDLATLPPERTNLASMVVEGVLNVLAKGELVVEEGATLLRGMPGSHLGSFG